MYLIIQWLFTILTYEGQDVQMFKGIVHRIEIEIFVSRLFWPHFWGVGGRSVASSIFIYSL